MSNAHMHRSFHETLLSSETWVSYKYTAYALSWYAGQRRVITLRDANKLVLRLIGTNVPDDFCMDSFYTIFRPFRPIIPVARM